MIVTGQVHGGLTMGLAPALYEEISYDEGGNVRGGSFVDYLLPGQFSNIRRVFVDNKTERPTLWIGDNHGANVVHVEPLD